MFAIERVKIIKNHLNKDQKVSVAKLSELLNVTEVTIRRDLEKLEKEGFLKRTHGGAVALSYVEENQMDENTDHYEDELCQEIASTAYHLVSDFESIMLTNGPTNLQIAKKLATRSNLTVVTNDIRIAMEFSGSLNNTLIMIGGDLDNYAVFGQMAIDNMKNFSFNHLFIEIDGMSKEIGMTVSSIKKASLIQQALPLAETVTVVCLSRYFGEKSLYRVGSLEVAQKVVTDSKLADHYKNYIFNLNIPLFTSIEIYEE
ncbi:MAG: DeoR/GlpR transcriptional regulator [Vallitaleaceae bacterium]|nr:DeoR/GlpR transcriptional regulator [Vallitaleaceae bacterium]